MEKRMDRKLQVIVGRTLRLTEAGYSVAEIAKEVNVSESDVRTYLDIIDRVKRMKGNPEENES